MKMHWSPRSPFVRKAMIAIHEMGLQDQVTCVRTVASPFKAHEELMDDNPLSKLPTLVLDDGTVVYDSHVICEYLDTLHAGPHLFPAVWPERLIALRNEALGDGLMDLGLLWLIERWRGEGMQSADLVTANARKVERVLARLEADVTLLADRPFDIGHLTIGTALGYLDFRFPFLEWRNGRPALAAWHAGFLERPSVQANPVVDDS
ncbi:glutathione S-transferase family protein [Xanthobacter autotrophicus DSM 431]|uniref:glutathione S-transferase family protein n=1 Tax=Xanthobacter nonsaccharivorans TaxID=3119912 RepID=UPI00372ABB6D